MVVPPGPPHQPPRRPRRLLSKQNRGAVLGRSKCGVAGRREGAKEGAAAADIRALEPSAPPEPVARARGAGRGADSRGAGGGAQGGRSCPWWAPAAHPPASSPATRL